MNNNYDKKIYVTYCKKPKGTMTVNNRKVKKYNYYLNGKLVTQPKTVSRLRSLYIPPAYRNVIISKSPFNKIQAIGVDDRGRKQYIYHPNFIKSQISKKYQNIRTLGKTIIDIETDNKNEIRKLCKKRVCDLNLPEDYIPIIVFLLLNYHFRIGNQKYEHDNNSFGITTLKKEHIKFLDNQSHFKIQFNGKKGVINSVEDNNETIYKLLKMLVRNCNQDPHLFCYPNRYNRTTLITPELVKNYFKTKYNADITPKMFRTWYANYHLLSYLKDINKNRPDLIGKRMTKKQINALVKNSSTYVSQKLNNTPSISKKSYIDPKLLNTILLNPSKFINQIPNNKKKIHTHLHKLWKDVN